MPDRRILVVGVGNPLRGDDGLGPTAVKILQHMRLPAEVEVRESSNLFDLVLGGLKDYSRLLIVDAVRRGSKPGTLHVFTPKLEGGESGVLSLHEAGIHEILRLGKMLNCLPGEVIILGCEPLETGYSMRLSEPVRRSLPKLIYQLLLEIIKTLGKND